MEFSRSRLDAVLASMGVTDQTGVDRYGSGHINDTYKVETAGGRRFILQHVAEDIFGDLASLERTIRRVTAHLASKGEKTLEVAAYEGAWRLYSFIEGYKTFDVVETPAQAYAVARAVARFQNCLADLPPPRLDEILPRFHDTPDRLRLLDAAVRADVRGRAPAAAKELAFVDKRREEASRLVSLVAAGEIPERVAHNDAKINNVMLSPQGDGIVIDLDTVMPGTALSDFGDMVRASAASAAEDESDLSKVFARRDCFEALARGYASEAKFLNEAEKANMVFAAKLATFEVGVRFLTDYLSGDNYFHIAYRDHNLVRARNQFKMVESIEAQSSDFEGIVRAALA